MTSEPLSPKSPKVESVDPIGDQPDSSTSIKKNLDSGVATLDSSSFALDGLTIDDSVQSQIGSPLADTESDVTSPVNAVVPAPLNNENRTSRLIPADELELISRKFPKARMEAGRDLVKHLGSIPDKMAFKIGEAAEMVGVKQYVLRYWESEFEALRPRKSKNNQRIYSRRDVETAMMIRKLLYEDRFSIEGARSALKQLKKHVKEEKGIQALTNRQELATNQLHGILKDIRRLKAIFN